MVSVSQILFNLAVRQTVQEFQLGRRKWDPGSELAGGRTGCGLGRHSRVPRMVGRDGSREHGTFTGKEKPLADACACVGNGDWRERQGQMGSCPG